MSFRVKSAWISVITMVIAYGAYVAVVAYGLMEGRRPGLWFLYPLGLYVICLTVMQIVLHVIVAARAPDEAKAPQDEREKLITWKATTVGYYVMIVAVVATMASVHLHVGAFHLVNGMFLALVLAEVVKWSAQIVLFRRGS